MRKEELTFYKEYEQFYAMAGKSEAFAEFCREAFGDDFSQDGFSDWRQAAYADEPYESYSRKLARYAYTVRKPE